ncbi:MAG TPA: hypothetical protein VFJ81_07430 [Gemmatimonadales bacterium]|nr:hypothetical protein [Gemmatimonadales bacterium]
MRALRLTALTTFAILLGAAPGRLAPITSRFRVDQTLTQDVDATAAGKGRQRVSFSTSSFLTVTLNDTAGGKAVRIVVDSMRGDSASPIPTSVFDSARGAEFHAFLSAAGKLSTLEAVNVSPAAARVQGFLTDFFPWVKARAKPGEQWADTSTQATTNGLDSVVVRRVTSYRVAGRETRGARKALRVTSEYSSTIRGTQPTDTGQPARIEGSGTGSGVYFVSPDGAYLGGDWRLESALTIAGAFAEHPLPITISQTTKVTPIP